MSEVAPDRSDHAFRDLAGHAGKAAGGALDSYTRVRRA